MIASDIFERNAYRVLRLSASATYSDVPKAAANFKRMATLGLSETTEADLPQLGKISRTDIEIRSAVNRMETPEHRLKDRLFWFHLTPKPLDEKATAQLLRKFEGDRRAIAAINHDNALHAIITALGVPLDENGASLWVQAIGKWHQVITNDEYWSLIQAVEERGRFEPAVLHSEIHNLKDNAIRLTCEPLIISTRDAVANNDASTVRRALNCLNELSNTGAWAELAQEEITLPLIAQFEKLCRTVSAECGNGIIREENQGSNNKKLCDAAISRYRKEIDPALVKLLECLPIDYKVSQQAKEDAARCLQSIAIDCTWANDLTSSEQLHEDSLKLAGDSAVAIGIKEGLDRIREMQKKLRIFRDLKPMSGVPLLFTFNGIGFTLYGHSEYDAETQSFVAIYYFTVIYVPVFPIARYRVTNEKGNMYRFLGKLPLRTFDHLHLGIAAVAVIVAIIVGNVNAKQNPSGSTFNSGYRATGSGYSQSNNPTTRSNVDYSKQAQLANLKNKIEAGRARHAELETQLKPVIGEISTLKERMNALQAELDSLKLQKPFRTQHEIDYYNKQVDAYNALLGRARQLASSADFQALSNLEDLDTSLVNQYNALLKGNQ
jgi:hypothetical protein